MIDGPSRIDADLYAPGHPPFILAGGTNFISEKVVAYEIGYRIRPIEKVSLSLATFFNHYDDLRSVTTNGTAFVLANGLRGETWGVELSANYQPVDWWRLRGGYDYLHKYLWSTTGQDTGGGVREGNDPEHQFSLQSIMELPAHFELDLTARYVDTLPSPQVPSYFSFDVRLAWRFKRLELSLVGQNLWDDQHPEFGAMGTRQEIPRSIYGKATWRF